MKEILKDVLKGLEKVTSTSEMNYQQIVLLSLIMSHFYRNNIVTVTELFV